MGVGSFSWKGMLAGWEYLRLEKWDVRICLTIRNAGRRSYRGMINGGERCRGGRFVFPVDTSHFIMFCLKIL